MRHVVLNVIYTFCQQINEDVSDEMYESLSNAQDVGELHSDELYEDNVENAFDFLSDKFDKDEADNSDVEIECMYDPYEKGVEK